MFPTSPLVAMSISRAKAVILVALCFVIHLKDLIPSPPPLAVATDTANDTKVQIVVASSISRAVSLDFVMDAQVHSQRGGSL